MKLTRPRTFRTLLLLPPVVAGLLFLRPVKADPLEDRFREFDKDGDGRVSMAELEKNPALKRLDLDGDGYVTLEETRQGMKQVRGAIAKRVGGGGGDGAQGTVPVEKLFQQVDVNDDGKLTPQELPREDWFAKLDTDKDGTVVLEEVRGVLGSNVPRRYLPAPEDLIVIPKPDESLKEQPQLLKPSDHGVGRLVPDVALKNLKGEDVSLEKLKGSKGLVLALFSASCPISNKLGPEYARLEKFCSEKGLAMAMVNAVPEDTPADVRKFVETHQLKATVLNDPGLALLSALEGTATTEVFVLDAARTLVYRGAVNDQYGLGYSKESPSRHYLRDALEDVAEGRVVRVAATTAPGCALELPASGRITTSPGVTYHNQVARIMQNNCVTCHRAEGAGPFSLESLADVKEHAPMIKKQVERGAMPPWFAAGDATQSETPWANDCSLSTKDKGDLLAWLASADRPEGDAKDAPLPRKFAGAWSIGEPEAVFQLPKAFAIKAEGTMPYQRATVTTSFPEDRWVQAYEILPTAPQVVHHVIVRVHEKGAKVVDGDEGREGYWAAYVPGNTHRVLPQGYAKRLPAGATISFQIHYTPNGKPVEDQLKIGLIFAKQPPQFEVKVAAVAHPRLNIPPGAADHVESRTQAIPMDMLFSAYMAHMHLRGKAFKYEVTYPDGKSEVLLDIPRYDFNWQLAYDYKQPKFIPRGSVLKITAVYDNSSGNPANPDPSKTVRWGSQTFDEMMIGYVEHYVPVPMKKLAQNGSAAE